MSAAPWSPELLARMRRGDRDAYRVAADALLERGDPAGDAILDGLGLKERPNPSTQRELKERIAKHQRANTATLAELGVTAVRLRWGLVDEVDLGEASLRHLPRLLELAPIRALRVRLRLGDDLAEAMRHPSFGEVERLTVDSGPALVKAIRQPAPALTALAIRAPCAFDPAVVPHLPALTRLYVTSGPDAWLQAPVHWPALAHLSVPGSALTAPAVKRLSDAPCNLETLNLGVPRAGSSIPVLQSEALRALHTVCVASSTGRYVFASIAVSAIRLPALKQLLSEERVQPKVAAELRARGIRLGRIRTRAPLSGWLSTSTG